MNNASGGGNRKFLVLHAIDTFAKFLNKFNTVHIFIFEVQKIELKKKEVSNNGLRQQTSSD